VTKALKQVQTILDTTRNPRLAGEEEHKYEDKYALTEFLTNTAIAAQRNALERLGLTPELFALVNSWVVDDKKTVTLRFQAQDTCTFLKEQQIKVALDQGFETTTTTTTATNTNTDSAGTDHVASSSSSSGGMLFGRGKKTKTETTKATVTASVTEFHFKVGISYKVVMFAGNDPNTSVMLQTRESSTIIVSNDRSAPIAEKTMHPPVDTNLTWFFQMISP
jgi:hypothetical protein